MENKKSPVGGGIELLPAKAPEGRSAALIFWARAVGIPLILILQFISLSVLAFRGKVEMDLRALSSSLTQKEEVLAQSAELEAFLLDTQARLNLLSQVKSTLCYSCTFQKISSLTPSKVSLTSLIVEDYQVEISATASAGASFATFVANILEDDVIAEAALTSGGLDRSGNFIFAMELTLDKTKAETRQ